MTSDYKTGKQRKKERKKDTNTPKRFLFDFIF